MLTGAQGAPLCRPADPQYWQDLEAATARQGSDAAVATTKRAACASAAMRSVADEGMKGPGASLSAMCGQGRARMSRLTTPHPQGIFKVFDDDGLCSGSVVKKGTGQGDMSGSERGRRKRFSREEIEQIRQMLLEKREEILRNVAHLENDSLGRPRKDASGDLSAVPFHMADLASDNYEQEFTLGLLQTEDVGLREVDEALRRLNDGTYGVCAACGRSIPKARLRALPYARMCLECKKSQEQSEAAPGPTG